MLVRFINYSDTSVTILSDDLNVLYGLGGFEVNFVKSGLLVLMALMFLAALGVFASSWMSFGVGCLMSFTVLWVGSAMGFLTEAISLGTGSGETGPMMWMYSVSGVMLDVMKVLLPNLSTTMLTDFLVEGKLITWSYLGSAALLTVGLRTVLLLALGCFVFQRRELSRVQV